MAKRVVYSGVEMIEGWPERIEEAQTIVSYSIGGIKCPRVRYGAETDEWGQTALRVTTAWSSRLSYTSHRAMLNVVLRAEGRRSAAIVSTMMIQASSRMATAQRVVQPKVAARGVRSQLVSNPSVDGEEGRL